MIIQIRGTSGSGKTWVMRQVMNQLGPWKPQYTEGRRKPLYYSNVLGVAVLGHYEATCGGCDNIGSAAQVYQLIQRLTGNHRVILCEGLLLSEDVKWTSQLDDVRVIYLVTPIEKCIELIKQRRANAGNAKPLNEHNTRNRVAVIERSRVKLLDAGVLCRRVTANQAPKLIEGWISNAYAN